ncbi:MAG: DUF4390 domain-containing protein, partial [Bdellovibrionales bacterium]|nr:DUF4390 domain-containing protein [Bdellovibrionales bacterium]
MLLVFIFALPEPIVSWHANQGSAIDIKMGQINQTSEKCLGSGLEVRYKYQFQICRRRTGWFPECSKERRIFHTMRFDPITETYNVVRDRHGDSLPPLHSTFEEKELAVEALSQIFDLNLKYLARGDRDLLQSDRT